MKKHVVLISTIMFSLAGLAAEIGNSWLETGDTKIECKKIRMGSVNARVVLVNGEKKTVPISTVISCSVNGKTFTRLPVFRNGYPTGKTELMELVRTVGELSLYKLTVFNTDYYGDKYNRYFLYRGDKIYLEVTEENLPNVSKVFGLTI